MGHIVVMDDSEAQFALTRYSQNLWRNLAPEVPADCEYVETGTLWVAADEEEMDEVRRKRDFYAAKSVPVEILDAHELRRAEPSLRDGLEGALLVANDAVVYPPCVAVYLLRRAGDLGVALKTGCTVERLDDRGVRLQDGSVLAAGYLVNAAGAAAARLTPQLPVVPRKGHLLITDRYPMFAHHQLVELGYLKSAHKTEGDSVAFNLQPRKTGQLLIGSSRQYGNEGAEIDQSILGDMLARAIEYTPTLASLSAIRCWTGFRAATPDKLPLIGRCPGSERVYAATGHEGLGITTSLGTARLLADQLTGADSPIPALPYQAERSMVFHA
jgi:glycine/D-amino acid oxidase-like deaminating enzyme